MPPTTTTTTTAPPADGGTQSQLGLSDFDREGLEVEALALFTAGEAGSAPALYSASGSRWTASGSLLAGDAAIGPDQEAIVRIMHVMSEQGNSTLRLNDGGPLVLGDYFGSGGAGHDLTVWVQTAGGTTSFAASSYRSAGGNYINFGLSSQTANLIADIRAGDRFILALTRPGPELTISRDQESVTEGETAQFTITSDRAVSTDLTVKTYQSQNGGFATWTGPGTVTMPKGSTSARAAIETVEDSTSARSARTTVENEREEDTGSVTMTLNSGTGYTVGSSSSASVTVIDDDQAVALPVASISRDQVSVTEAGTAEFTISLDKAAPTDLTVKINQSQNGDFADWTGHGDITIDQGDKSFRAAITLDDDEIDEPHGSVTMALRTSDITGYTVKSSQSSTSVTVYDNDDPVALPANCEQAVLWPGYKVCDYLGGRGVYDPNGWKYLGIVSDGWIGKSEYANGVHRHKNYFPGFNPDSELGVLNSYVEFSSPLSFSYDRDLPLKIKRLNVVFVTIKIKPDGSTEVRPKIPIISVKPVNDFIDDTILAANDSIERALQSAWNALSFRYNVDSKPIASLSKGRNITEGGTANFTISVAPAVVNGVTQPDEQINVVFNRIIHGEVAASSNSLVPSLHAVNLLVTGSRSYPVSTYNDGEVNTGERWIQVQLQDGLYYNYDRSSYDWSIKVLDDDQAVALPVASISRDQVSVTEAGTAEFTISLDKAAPTDLTVKINQSQNGDFADWTGHGDITIDQGDKSFRAAITLDDDEIDEPHGSVTMALRTSDITGYTVKSSQSSATVTVTDNDLPPVTTTTTPVTAPSVPRYLSGSSTSSSVSLSWSVPSSNGGASIDGYKYRYKLSSGSSSSWTSWTSWSSSPVTIHGRSPGTSYDFEVRAYNSAGDGSVASVSVTTSTPASVPSAPLRLSGSSNSAGTLVTLSWNAPSSNGGASIDGYEYRHKRSSYSSSWWTSWTSWSSTSVTIHGRSPGTSYDFEVRAYNSAGDGSVASVSVTTSTPASVPSAPLRLSGSSNSAGTLVTLSWNAPSSNGGASIDGYEYRHKRSSYSSSWWTSWTSRSSTSVTIGGLSSGTSYDFEVRARNSAGAGSVASTTVTTTAVALPVITVSRYSSTVTEGGTVYFRVHSNKAVPANLSVSFSRSQNGSFASWSGSGTVTISSGASQSGWVSVSTVNDTTDEPNGSLTMSLNSGSGYSVGLPSSASVTVYDNDDTTTTPTTPTKPVLTLSRDQSSVTEGQPAEFTITSNKAAPTDLTVKTYQSQNGGFATWTGAGTVTIPEGSTSARVGITTVDDSRDEANGSVTMSLNSGSGYSVGLPSSASVTVYDNDDTTTTPTTPTKPVLTLSRDQSSVTEGQPAEFTITSNKAAPTDLTVKTYQSQNGGFATWTGAGTVTIPEGSTSARVGITTVDDSRDEANGSVTMSLNSGSGYSVGLPSSASVTVYDNDDTTTTPTTPTKPVLTLSRDQSSVTEGQPAEFTITSNKAAPTDLTVKTYQSQNGGFATWTGAGTVTIPEGSTSARVGITTVDDSRDEANGSVTMALSVVDITGYTVGSPSSASVTVYDNDDTTTQPTTGTTVTTTTGTELPACRDVEHPTTYVDETYWVATTYVDETYWVATTYEDETYWVATTYEDETYWVAATYKQVVDVAGHYATRRVVDVAGHYATRRVVDVAGHYATRRVVDVAGHYATRRVVDVAGHYATRRVVDVAGHYATRRVVDVAGHYATRRVVDVAGHYQWLPDFKTYVWVATTYEYETYWVATTYEDETYWVATTYEDETYWVATTYEYETYWVATTYEDETYWVATTYEDETYWVATTYEYETYWVATTYEYETYWVATTYEDETYWVATTYEDETYWVAATYKQVVDVAGHYATRRVVDVLGHYATRRVVDVAGHYATRRVVDVAGHYATRQVVDMPAWIERVCEGG